MIDGLSIKTNKQGKQNIYIPANKNADDGEVILYYLQEHKDLMDKIENYDVKNTPEYSGLLQKYTELKESIPKVYSDFKELKDNSKLTVKNDELQRKIDEYTNAYEDMIEKVNIINQEKIDLSIELKTLENSVKGTIEVHKSLIENKENIINQLNRNIDKLNDTLDNVTNKLKSKDDKINELNVKVKTLKNSIQSQQDKIQELTQILNDTQSKLSESDENYNQLKIVCNGLIGYLKNIKWYNLLLGKANLKEEINKMSKLLKTPADTIDIYPVVDKD